MKRFLTIICKLVLGTFFVFFLIIAFIVSVPAGILLLIGVASIWISIFNKKESKKQNSSSLKVEEHSNNEDVFHALTDSAIISKSIKIGKEGKKSECQEVNKDQTYSSKPSHFSDSSIVYCENNPNDTGIQYDKSENRDPKKETIRSLQSMIDRMESSSKPHASVTFSYLTYDEYEQFIIPEISNISVRDYNDILIRGVYYSVYDYHSIRGFLKDNNIEDLYCHVRNEFKKGIYYDLDYQTTIVYMKILAIEISHLVMNHHNSFDEDRFTRTLNVLNAISTDLIRDTFDYCESYSIKEEHTNYWQHSLCVLRAITVFIKSNGNSSRHLLTKVPIIEYEELSFLHYKLISLIYFDYKNGEEINKYLVRMIAAFLNSAPRLTKYFSQISKGSSWYSSDVRLYMDYIYRTCYRKLYSIVFESDFIFVEFAYNGFQKPFLLMTNASSLKDIDTLLDNIIDETGGIPFEVIQDFYHSNSQYWKEKLSKLESQLSADKNIGKYIEEIDALTPKLLKCSNVYLYYIAVIKTLMSIEVAAREKAFEYYLRLRAIKDEDKGFKTITKKLLQNELVSNRFESILMQYRKDNDLSKANEALKHINDPERRKIVIAKQSLAVKESSYQTTVAMLDEIMEDEEQTAKDEVAVKPVDVDIVDKGLDSPSNNDLIDVFVENGYYLSATTIEDIAKHKGTMPSLMIDEINEFYYEQLDDNLIEQNGEKYIINADYLKTISR